MVPQPTDFFSQFAADHSAREATAAAERFRRNKKSVPPRTASTPAVAKLRPVHSCTPVA
jgi:hypothetical protein